MQVVIRAVVPPWDAEAEQVEVGWETHWEQWGTWSGFPHLPQSLWRYKKKQKQTPNRLPEGSRMEYSSKITLEVQERSPGLSIGMTTGLCCSSIASLWWSLEVALMEPSIAHRAGRTTELSFSVRL